MFYLCSLHNYVEYSNRVNTMYELRIRDRACKNQPCECKLHQVIFVTGFTKTVPIGTRNEIQFIADY